MIHRFEADNQDQPFSLAQTNGLQTADLETQLWSDCTNEAGTVKLKFKVEPETTNESDTIDNSNCIDTPTTSEAYVQQPVHPDYSYTPDIKVGVQELCPVCGDKVSGYHYGLLTCESCKGFFKRTVQNKKVYSCVDNRGCHIDKSQRKRCPYCRFQKCLLVGMKLEAVREDRMRGGRNKFGPMYKRDRALKQQAMRQHQHIMASCHMYAVNTATEDVKPDPSVLLSESNYGFLDASRMYKDDVFTRGLGTGKEVYGLSSSALNGSVKNACPASVTAGKDVVYPRNSNTPKVQSYPSTHSMAYNGSGLSEPCGFYSVNSSDENGNIDVNSNICVNDGRNQHSGGDGQKGVQHALDINRNVAVNRNQNHREQATGVDYSEPNVGLHSGSIHTMREDMNFASRNANSESKDYFPPDKSQTAYDMVYTYIPKLIQQMQVTMLDEVQVRNKLMSFIQSDIDELDSLHRPHKFLHVMCQLADQCLFLMVEWARSSVFFKDLRVECQMRLLHHCWGELLILDFVHRQLSHSRPNEFVLASGHVISASYLDSLGLTEIKERLQDLTYKLRDLDFDYNEYACLKFLLLLNHDRATSDCKLYVEQYQEQVSTALLEYCMTFHSNVSDKFGQLLRRLPDIRTLSIRLEEFLYYKHLNREIPEQTLLMEMLHSKHK